jgi:hypothetical protein
MDDAMPAQVLGLSLAGLLVAGMAGLRLAHRRG